MKVEVTVKCIDGYDCIYNCNATYSSAGNVFMETGADDYTKALASDTLYMTHTVLRSQIKDDAMTKARIDQCGYIPNPDPWEN